MSSNVILWGEWLVWTVRILSAGSSVSGSIVVPLKVSVSEALQLLGSNIVVGVLSEWIGPSCTFSINLGSNIVVGSVWLVWGERFLVASSSVGGSIIMPLLVSVSQAFQFLRSNVIVEILPEWISPSSSFTLG